MYTRTYAKQTLFISPSRRVHSVRFACMRDVVYCRAVGKSVQLTAHDAKLKDDIYSILYTVVLETNVSRRTNLQLRQRALQQQ
jgi:hypothetical protein